MPIAPPRRRSQPPEQPHHDECDHGHSRDDQCDSQDPVAGRLPHPSTISPGATGRPQLRRPGSPPAAPTAPGRADEPGAAGAAAGAAGMQRTSQPLPVQPAASALEHARPHEHDRAPGRDRAGRSLRRLQLVRFRLHRAAPHLPLAVLLDRASHRRADEVVEGVHTSASPDAAPTTLGTGWRERHRSLPHHRSCDDRGCSPR